MKVALAKDHESIILKKCAIERLKLSEIVDDQLRKKHIQAMFLENNGCQILAEWIDMNPDKTFPLV